MQYKRVIAFLSLKMSLFNERIYQFGFMYFAASSPGADYYVTGTLNSFAVMTSQDSATSTVNEPALLCHARQSSVF